MNLILIYSILNLFSLFLEKESSRSENIISIVYPICCISLSSGNHIVMKDALPINIIRFLNCKSGYFAGENFAIVSQRYAIRSYNFRNVD